MSYRKTQESKDERSLAGGHAQITGEDVRNYRVTWCRTFDPRPPAHQDERGAALVMVNSIGERLVLYRDPARAAPAPPDAFTLAELVKLVKLPPLLDDFDQPVEWSIRGLDRPTVRRDDLGEPLWGSLLERRNE